MKKRVLGDEKRQINKVRIMEMHMLHWMGGLILKDRVRNKFIRDNLTIAPIDNKYERNLFEVVWLY